MHAVTCFVSCDWRPFIVMRCFVRMTSNKQTPIPTKLANGLIPRRHDAATERRPWCAESIQYAVACLTEMSRLAFVLTFAGCLA